MVAVGHKHGRDVACRDDVANYPTTSDLHRLFLKSDFVCVKPVRRIVVDLCGPTE